MMACTSPDPTVSVTPLRISLPSTLACRSSTLRSGVVPIAPVSVSFGSVIASPDRPFEAHREEILGFDRELHRQLLEHGLAEAADDHVDGILFGDSAGQAVEQL